VNKQNKGELKKRLSSVRVNAGGVVAKDIE
jgi:hypothetical protein